MGHFRTCTCRYQRGDARIAEKIEHLNAASGLYPISDKPIHIGPMRGLLWEHANMAERGETAMKGNAIVLHWPCFAERHFRKGPASHAFLVGVAGEDGIGLVPFLLRQARQPDCLTFRADDPIGTILLELQPVAAVEKRIIGRGFRFENERQSFSRACTGLRLDFA